MATFSLVLLHCWQLRRAPSPAPHCLPLVWSVQQEVQRARAELQQGLQRAMTMRRMGRVQQAMAGRVQQLGVQARALEELPAVEQEKVAEVLQQLQLPVLLLLLQLLLGSGSVPGSRAGACRRKMAWEEEEQQQQQRLIMAPVEGEAVEEPLPAL